MNNTLHDELTDAVLRAPLEPDAWADVMQLVARRFPSVAQTFYFLDLEPRRVRPQCLRGIEPGWLGAFNALYFTPDNPWLRLTERLHRPGIVRTSERLDRVLEEADSLCRCAYYNEWMRPQGFRHTLGTTLFADDSMVANVTLLRPPDMAPFDDAEVREFERLSGHLTRALQVAVRLERSQSGAASAAALEAMPQPVALIDADRRLIFANPSMEALLRRGNEIAVRGGVLRATRVSAQQDLERLVAAALSIASEDAPSPLVIPGADGSQLSLQAVPISAAAGRYLRSQPTLMLLATEALSVRAAAADELRGVYRCTRAETRLALLLAEGCTLRTAATTLGVTYGTARACLTAVFEKVGVHSQTQLVARVLGSQLGD